MLERSTGLAVPPPTEDGLVVMELVSSVEEVLLEVLFSVALEVPNASLRF